jgi:energy-coupling factor transporter transmembrane protein EcfT
MEPFIDKKFTKFFLLLLLLVFFLIVFLYFQNKKSAKNNFNIPKSAITPIVSTTLVDWKTYTDGGNGYQFFYPPSWKIENVTSSYLQLVPPNKEDNEEGRIIIVVEKKNLINLDQFMDEVNPATGTKNKDVFFPLQKIKNKKGEGLLTKGGCCGLFGRHVFFVHNHKLYQITLKGPPKSTSLKNEEIFKKIISSFKFLD